MSGHLPQERSGDEEVPLISLSPDLELSREGAELSFK